mmetsp:Transcript_129493/g.322783  ORF Transcript_129493/g.322783 Transcript_129493/m.322783 type:complete len:148 (+) Transcript_129493:50-493(+)
MAISAAAIGSEAAFAAFDRDRDGLLGASDLEHAIRAVGHEAKAETLRALAGQSGGLDLEGFRKVVADAGADAEKNLMPLALQLCGVKATEGDEGEQTPLIGPDGLKKVFEILGMEASEEEMKELIRGFDSDGDGLLSMAEFAAILGL